MKQTTSIQNRMTDAVRLRDAAVELAKAKGDWKMFGPNIKVGQLDCGNLSIWHSLFPHCFGIDVWDASGKVLNVQWTDAGVDIVTFRRGDWESELFYRLEDIAWEDCEAEASRQQAA